jgi:hypothetical protein
VVTERGCGAGKGGCAGNPCGGFKYVGVRLQKKFPPVGHHHLVQMTRDGSRKGTYSPSLFPNKTSSSISILVDGLSVAQKLQRTALRSSGPHIQIWDLARIQMLNATRLSMGIRNTSCTDHNSDASLSELILAYCGSTTLPTLSTLFSFNASSALLSSHESFFQMKSIQTAILPVFCYCLGRIFLAENIGAPSQDSSDRLFPIKVRSMANRCKCTTIFLDSL